MASCPWVAVVGTCPPKRTRVVQWQTCRKQYKTAMEMEAHLSSYDHHHTKVTRSPAAVLLTDAMFRTARSYCCCTDVPSRPWLYGRAVSLHRGCKR